MCGYVVDFMSLLYFVVFNVVDIFIMSIVIFVVVVVVFGYYEDDVG